MSELIDMEDTTGLTIQEASKILSIPENTLRKYLTYFEITVEKQGRKTLLSKDSMNCLSEIVQLKGNGWSLKDIKNFRDKQPASGANKEITNTEIANEDNPITLSEEIIQTPEELFPIKESSQEILEKSPEIINEQEEFPSNDNLQDRFIANQQNNSQENQEDKEIEPSILSFTKESDEIPLDNKDETSNLSHDDLELQLDENQDVNLKIKLLASKVKLPLTKDLVNKEIAVQAKRASRLYRFLSSRNAPRDSAEIKADLDRRVIFLNGLRYLRDNWLERKSADPHQDERLVTA